VDVIISDDGLQHYRLGRDLELAVVDGSRRLGNGRLLPAGPLREPGRRLEKVDLVLVNGGEAGGHEAAFHLIGGTAVLPDGSDGQPLEAFRGRTVRMLAGIGNPDRFRRLLESAGLVVAESLAVDDHGRVDEVLLRSAGPPIFMTSKDAVKYQLPADGSIRVVPVTAAMPAFLDRWLEERLDAMPAPQTPDAPAQRGTH
jgi:tetraacyldisaccharide 4'-kinase